jgi:hypothetical protein
VDRLDPGAIQQLVEVGGAKRDPGLLRQLARPLGVSRPDRDRLELLESAVCWERDLGSVAPSEDTDLHRIAHRRLKDTTAGDPTTGDGFRERWTARVTPPTVRQPDRR